MNKVQLLVFRKIDSNMRRVNMNIIILAAGDKGITHKEKIIPRPLLPLKNGTSIIENLLNHIYLLTKGDCDIYLAINKSELWSKSNIEKLDTRIKIIWINNSDHYNNAKTVIELIDFLSEGDDLYAT